MRRKMKALLIAACAGLAGCTAATYGGPGGYTNGYGYRYGYGAGTAPIYAPTDYGYGSGVYAGSPAYYDRGPGWYRGDGDTWRRRVWQNESADREQQEQQSRQQVEQNRALYQQNQATYQRQVQENAAKYQQQVQQNRASYQQNMTRYNQQVQENRAAYARQQAEARQKMLGQ